MDNPLSPLSSGFFEDPGEHEAVTFWLESTITIRLAESPVSPAAAGDSLPATSNNGTGSLFSANAVLVLKTIDAKAIHADAGRAIRVGDHHVPSAYLGTPVRAD